MSDALPPSSPLPSLESKPKSSNLAIWSLALGILSIFTCGATALPGLITGIMGISATKDQKRRGRGMATVGVALSSLTLLTMIWWFLFVPKTLPVAERNKLHSSKAQIKQLVTILHLYAQDADGRFPPDWATAFEGTGIDGADLLTSPLGDDSAEYILLTPSANVSTVSPETVIVRDPHELHGKTVVGYVDGRVEIVSAKALAD
jgi:hypothetical protein